MGKPGSTPQRGRRYGEAFKAAAVRLVVVEGLSPEAAVEKLRTEDPEGKGPSIVSVRNWSQDRKLIKRARDIKRHEKRARRREEHHGSESGS